MHFKRIKNGEKGNKRFGYCRIKEAIASNIADRVSLVHSFIGSGYKKKIMISKINNRENLKGRIYWGIDLGTSYTVVAQVVGSSLEKTDNGQVPILLVAIEQQSPLELDAPETSELVASILAINDDSKMFVGNKLH